MNKEKPLDEKIEELKKEIEELNNYYGKGDFGYGLTVLKAKLSAYEDAQKIFREAILNILERIDNKYTFGEYADRHRIIRKSEVKEIIKQEVGTLADEEDLK